MSRGSTLGAHLREEQLQDENQQLEAQSQMDGDAVRQSESALRKEVAALKAQLATASGREGAQLVAVSGNADQAVAATDQAPPVTKTKDTTLKELAGDESLSEEARDSARKALEVLVSSQLLDLLKGRAVRRRLLSRQERLRLGGLDRLDSLVHVANRLVRLAQLV